MNHQQIQSKREMSAYDTAQVVAIDSFIHRSSCSNTWMVESEGVKGKCYTVEYVEGEMVCDRKAFGMGTTDPCKYILRVALIETGVH